MKELKLIIDNPKLEEQLEEFEDVVVLRELKHGECRHVVASRQVLSWSETAICPTERLVLTPKKKPLEEPDWSKLPMLKEGAWLAFNASSLRWCLSDGTKPDYCEESGYWLGSMGTTIQNPLSTRLFDYSLFPAVPSGREDEACWQVPAKERCCVRHQRL